MRDSRVLFLAVLLTCLVFVCSATSQGEDADAAKVLRDASCRAQTLEDIGRIYLALPEKHSSVGDLDRDSYFVWALSNYICDHIFSTYYEKIDRDVSTVAEFTEKHAFGVAELAERLAEANSDLPEIARMIVLAYAKQMFLAPVKDNRYDRGRDEVRLQIEGYRKKSSGYAKNPAIRQALSLLIGPCEASNYVKYEQKPGEGAIFLLVDMDKPSYKPTSGDKGAKALHLACPIPPIADKSKASGVVKVEGEFHPTLVFYRNAWPGAFLPDENLHHEPDMATDIVLNSPFIDSYFRGNPVFQKFSYDPSHLGMPSNIPKDANRLLLDFNGSHAPVYSDLRTIHVSAQFTISRKSREILDPRNQAYSWGMRLAGISENAGICTLSDLWDAIPKQQLPDFDRFDKYLKECEVFLAAFYPRTILTRAIASASETQGVYRATTFLTPDFSAEPTIFLVYIPLEWLRYTAYAGADNTLFEYNLMGLGDTKIELPMDVHYPQND